MAVYHRMDGTLISGRLTMVGGTVLPIKVSGLGPDRKHLQIKSTSPTVSVIVVSAASNNIEQRLQLKAQAVHVTTQVTLRAYAQNGNEDQSTPSVEIAVEPALLLPARETEAGILARVLLVEGVTPGQPQYSQAKVLSTMQLMRWVLVNRLAFGSEYFGAGKHATTLTDLIKALGQVAGFETYPNISPDQLDLLADILKIANDASHRQYSAYRQYVQNAIDVSQARALSADPCPTGLYAWRTAGSPGPGNNFVKYLSQGGQDFYTLTAEFKKDPLLRNKKK